MTENVSLPVQSVESVIARVRDLEEALASAETALRCYSKVYGDSDMAFDAFAAYCALHRIEAPGASAHAAIDYAYDAPQARDEVAR